MFCDLASSEQGHTQDFGGMPKSDFQIIWYDVFHTGVIEWLVVVTTQFFGEVG